MECKGRRLKKLGIISDGGLDNVSGRSFSDGMSGEFVEGGGRWRYTLHPEVASWSNTYVDKLRKDVRNFFFCCSIFQDNLYSQMSISVFGARVPRPLSTLDHIPFPDPGSIPCLIRSLFSMLHVRSSPH